MSSTTATDCQVPMEDASALLRPTLVTGNRSLGDVTRDICAPMERKATKLWWAAFLDLCTHLGGVLLQKDFGGRMVEVTRWTIHPGAFNLSGFGFREGEKHFRGDYLNLKNSAQ